MSGSPPQLANRPPVPTGLPPRWMSGQAPPTPRRVSGEVPPADKAPFSRGQSDYVIEERGNKTTFAFKSTWCARTSAVSYLSPSANRQGGQHLVVVGAPDHPRFGFELWERRLGLDMERSGCLRLSRIDHAGSVAQPGPSCHPSCRPRRRTAETLTPRHAAFCGRPDGDVRKGRCAAVESCHGSFRAVQEGVDWRWDLSRLHPRRPGRSARMSATGGSIWCTSRPLPRYINT